MTPTPPPKRVRGTQPSAPDVALLPGAVQGDPTPTTGAVPATPSQQEPLTTTTVGALRAILDEHDRGIFLRSALLADLMRRDPDIYGALQQRLAALLSHAVRFDATDATPGALEARDELAADWPRLLTPGATCDLATDEILMGFAVGQIVWRWDDEHGALRQTVEPWPAHAVEHDRSSRRWYVLTATAGRIAITHGDGQWLIFAPRSDRAPWLWGAIRPTAQWYLRGDYAAGDASRSAEVTGSPVWKAAIPLGARLSDEGKGFIRSLRTMGRNAVIPIPRGRTAEESYDVELVQAQVDAYRIFEFLMRAGGGKIRLAILGQDLTSQNHSVGTNASSSTGETVTRAVVEAQARGLSACVTAAVADPRAAYLGAPRTRVRIDAEPEADRRAAAEAQTAEAAAVTAWEALGVDVDVAHHAAQAGVHLRSTTITKAPAP